MTEQTGAWNGTNVIATDHGLVEIIHQEEVEIEHAGGTVDVDPTTDKWTASSKALKLTGADGREYLVFSDCPFVYGVEA